jgi:hypothetical protein
MTVPLPAIAKASTKTRSMNMYRELTKRTFVKTPDPPCASRLRYRRKQHI